MASSRMNTVNVQSIVSGDSSAAPTLVVKGHKVPLRVVCRNNTAGGVSVFLSYDSATLSNQPATANTFELPSGTSEVFIVEEDEVLYACTVGAPGILSIASSRAIPIASQS
jgi:hypothetical protein